MCLCIYNTFCYNPLYSFNAEKSIRKVKGLSLKLSVYKQAGIFSD